MAKNEMTIEESAKKYLDAKANDQIRYEKQYGEVTVVELKKWAGFALMKGDEFIVPFGRYDFINGFEHGLARVRSVGELNFHRNTEAVGTIENSDLKILAGEDMEEHFIKDFQEHREKYSNWGIINEKGEEVLPLEYDNIWNFFGKDFPYTNVVKDGITSKVYFSDLISDGNEPYIANDYNDDDDYGTHYGEYAGSYAQDVMGYSDDFIDDAFDGDPDAYWNID